MTSPITANRVRIFHEVGHSYYWRCEAGSSHADFYTTAGVKAGGNALITMIQCALHHPTRYYEEPFDSDLVMDEGL
jgi:hypothetical protein